jgi:TonB-dependent receptor
LLLLITLTMNRLTKAILCFTIFVLSSNIVFAQRGDVTGAIFDMETNEMLLGVTISSTTSNGGGYSDEGGVFTANFAAGLQTIVIDYIGYKTKTIENVTVTEGGVTDLGKVEIGYATESQVGVTVMVKRKTNTKNALIAAERKSVNVMSAVSSETMKKSGVSNAAAAAGKVSGVSIDGGKYVFVRGLGDRYTKTVLNGMELPGLDPDRNTVQMDIFPTILIDNIIVRKSFTPNLSGDFTGGWIDIKTKDFQEKEVFDVSVSLGYNPDMNLNKDFIIQSGNMGDAYAVGGRSRKLPFAEQKIPVSQWATNPELAQSNAAAFSKNMGVQQKTSLLNSSFSVNYANQKDSDGKTFGYNLAAGYSNTYTYYDMATYETYLRDEDKDENELILAEKNNGTVGENEVLWSALANGSYKRNKQSMSATLFHTQNGIKKTSKLYYDNIANPFGDAGASLDKDILYYNQRTLSSLMLVHTYENGDSSWKYTSRVSPSVSSNNEPDMRITALSSQEGQYEFNVGAGSEISRLYRKLFEYNLNTKFDAEKTFILKNKKKTKVQYGVANNIKSRDFGVIKYGFQAPSYDLNFNGDPNQIFNDYLFDAETQEGFFVFGEPIKSNQYTATSNVIGVYAMNEMPMLSQDRLNVVYGVRLEKADMFYTGENTQGLSFSNEKVLNEFNVLPSVNLIYKVTTKMNLRFAGTRTLARPSFKEKSLAQIFDPISGRTFIGNLDLEQTEVTNFDFRYEWYMNRGEVFSVGTFYKNFINPIETVVYTPETPTNFTPRNAKSANVYGVEVELKKGFKSLSNSLKNFYAATNISYIYSEVEMTEKEIEGKSNELRTGQSLGTKREMQGQAPYIINASLNYDNDESGLNANVSYNVQGSKLAIVGIGRVADVYSESFHSLNVKTSWTFGKNDKMKGSLSATNILADDKLQVYRSYEAQDQIFTQLRPMRTFKVGFSYSIK